MNASNSKPEFEPLSDREMARRQGIVNAAQGSLRLESLTVSDEGKSLQQRYVTGEITVQELIEATRKMAALEPAGL